MKKSQDGVIQFSMDYSPAAPLAWKMLQQINAWRQILYQLGLIGQDGRRYNGYGFGNISIRRQTEPSLHTFIISGAQTGGISSLTAEHYTLVKDFDLSANRVTAEGPVAPSSESLTHGILYDINRSTGAVIHIHSPDIWEHSDDLGIPATHPDIPYGTPEMAEQVCQLFQKDQLISCRIFSMGGHQDGIVTFGNTVEEAGLTAIRYLARAMARSSNK